MPLLTISQKASELRVPGLIGPFSARAVLKTNSKNIKLPIIIRRVKPPSLRNLSNSLPIVGINGASRKDMTGQKGTRGSNDFLKNPDNHAGNPLENQPAETALARRVVNEQEKQGLQRPKWAGSTVFPDAWGFQNRFVTRLLGDSRGVLGDILQFIEES